MKRHLILIAGGIYIALVSASAAEPNSVVKQTAKETTANSVKMPDTLMFSVDEYNDIQAHTLRMNTDTNGEKENEAFTLYLSTILYMSPTEWTVWINGVPIGPKEEFQSFKVTDISPTHVDLLVPLSAQGMSPVRLGPNQTFIARSGIVVEGRQQ